MATRARTKLSHRTKQTKMPISRDGPMVFARKPSQPPLVEPFYVAVDLQFKSGHKTYEAAEKAALAIKKQHPHLHVTVYDAKEQRHVAIKQPKPGADPTRNRLVRRAAWRRRERRRSAVAGAKG